MKNYAEVHRDSTGTIRVVRDGIKLYSSERRAMTYGKVRDAAPCGNKWVALPFWARGGGIHLYYTESEYARIYHEVQQ